MNKTTAVLGLLVAVVFASFVSAKSVDQPRMQAAKSDLLSARAQLMQADHNKGGHRTKAINLINQAVANINRGIAFDRRNNHAIATANPPASVDQPHMTRALDHLKDARNNLEQATPDKGGFRAKAISLVNEAIEEVKLGIAAASD